MSATPPVYDPRSTQFPTTLTPYLQLSHRLSLTWLAYPILSLLFVAFRLQLSSDSAQDAASRAKDDLIASCRAAEKAATAAASMPRYMAHATNERIADAVNGTMRGARAALILALTVMEAIINFIVDMYRSTFLCFLELVVRGALSILIGAVDEFNKFLSGTFSSIRTGIQNDISGINDAIKKVVDAANKVPLIGGSFTAPQLNVPSLDALQNVQLPSDFQQALQKLNSSLPTISDLKDKIDAVIDTPFELVKKDINDTFTGLSFDAAVLPVPEQNSVTFCQDMDTSVVDDLAHDLVKICKIGVIVIIVLALLLIAANCALEWYKWRSMKNHLQWTREAWTSDPTVHHTNVAGTPSVQLSDHNLMMLSADMEHPLLTRIANRITRLLRLSPSQHIHLSWFFHYIFHPPALACFLIGAVGLLSVQLQLLAIAPLEHHYTQQAQASVNDFSNTIATSINASMYNQSAAYANDVNGRVDHIQSTINEGLFGWVNGTTTTLNTTINTFYTDIQDAVNTVFGGTILESPVQEFIRCFIGTKVDAIEHALTFLHDNLNVDIPRVNDTVLVLSPDSVNEATRPIATAAIGGSDGNDQGVVGKLINAYVASLYKERIMFCIFMGLWGLVIIMALCVIFWHSYGKGLYEAYKKRRWQKKQRGGIEGIIVPFKDRNDGFRGASLGGDMEKQHDDQDPLSRPPNTLHPYAHGGDPAFQKSWDSFLDGANSDQGHQSRPALPIRLTRGLTRKDSKDSGSQRSATDDTPWLKRFTLAFWKRKDSQSDEEVPPNPRPQLTITTTNGSVKNLDSQQGRAEPPTSAWSVSPRRPTWMPNLAAPKMPSFSKHRHSVSVPDDVSSPEPLPEHQSAPAPYPVPLHHGFEWTHGEPTSPPFKPTSSQPPYTNIHLQPSRSVRDRPIDPFVTPFDDEHRAVLVDSPTSERRPGAATNPFMAM